MTRLQELIEERNKINALIREIQSCDVVYNRASMKAGRTIYGFRDTFAIYYKPNVESFVEKRLQTSGSIDGYNMNLPAYPIARGLTKQECIMVCEEVINDLTGLLNRIKESEDTTNLLNKKIEMEYKNR